VAARLRGLILRHVSNPTGAILTTTQRNKFSVPQKVLKLLIGNELPERAPGKDG
jgi:hypothetical protein